MAVRPSFLLPTLWGELAAWLNSAEHSQRKVPWVFKAAKAAWNMTARCSHSKVGGAQHVVLYW
jgi:hypothetical protein